jgi:ParB family transcriptional regulator, chromosome partitioning protein
VQKRNKKTGLPDSIQMRHDDHFVDLISSRSSGKQVRLISMKKISPNPHQARNELGEMEDLINSIKEKGVLEPILVRPKNNEYEIIAGERRYIASKRLNLDDIPCIVMNVTDTEALEISLIENLQRLDLDIFEESDGLKYLSENYGYSHDQISKKLGKARSTVTEMISLSRIPLEIRLICEEYGISSRSTLLEIAKQNNKDDMRRLINAIRERDLRRDDTRRLSKEIKGKKREEIKKYIYQYELEGNKEFKVRIEFRKRRVRREEIIKILEMMLEKLKSEKE